MGFQITRSLMQSSLIKIIFCLSLFAVLLAICWAGIRQNLSGDTIREDVVAPAGGARITDASSNVVNASAGQCAVGLSQSGSGYRLYHGVHAPIRPETNVRNWQVFGE
jgi:hypothetical protein